MSNSAPAQPAVRRSATRRPRWVLRLLQIVLPALVLGCIGVAFFWSTLMPQDDRLRVGIDFQRDPITGERDAMIGASYSGIDSAGRPFTVTAARIRRETPESATMLLTGPEATLTLAGGDVATLRAETGTYDRVHEVIELAGDVRLQRLGRLDARTSRASIDIGAGSARGDEAVEASGTFGTVRGVGFTVAGKGALITVGGPARLVFSDPPQKQKGESR